MNNSEFAEFVRGELARIQKLIDDKNADYAGTGGSAFANFYEEAEALDLSVEKVWHVWVFKHWTAVTSFCKRGNVRSEPIDGRLDDVIGYCLLLKGILRERVMTRESSDSGSGWLCQGFSGAIDHPTWLNSGTHTCTYPGCGALRPDLRPNP